MKNLIFFILFCFFSFISESFSQKTPNQNSFVVSNKSDIVEFGMDFYKGKYFQNNIERDIKIKPHKEKEFGDNPNSPYAHGGIYQANFYVFIYVPIHNEYLNTISKKERAYVFVPGYSILYLYDNHYELKQVNPNYGVSTDSYDYGWFPHNESEEHQPSNVDEIQSKKHLPKKDNSYEHDAPKKSNLE